jgi:hypothetical protein
MQLFDSIRHHLQEYRGGWAIGVFCVLCFGGRYSKTVESVLKSPQFFYAAAALGVVLTLAYSLATILYFLYPNYLDHYEPTVSAISWLGTHGHPIYPNLNNGDIYGAPYGPLLFITDGTALQFFPTIQGAKLPGLVSFYISLGITYAALAAKAQNNRGAAILSLMIVIAVFSFFHSEAHAFWTRAEPFLILIAVLTVVAAANLPVAAAAATVGILAGFAVDFKLHGALYALPAGLAILGTAKTWKQRVEIAILSFILTIGAALLPFLLLYGRENSIIQGYASVLSLTAEHGLSLALLIDNSLFALTLFLPIVLAGHFRRPTVGPFDYWFLVGLFLSLVMTTLIASKPGAGQHHFLPLVPLSAYALLSVLTAPASGEAPKFNARELGSIFLVSLLVSYAPGELWWTTRFATVFAAQQTEKRKINELQALYHQFPQAEVGLSDDSGVSETKAVELLKRCQVPEWILPKGSPFTLLNYYTKLPLFSDDFRRTFFSNYKPVQQGEFYQVWKC